MSIVRSLFFVVSLYLFFVALAFFGEACLPPPDGCTPITSRCNGPRAEVCDADTRWELVMDCNDVAAQSGGAWACCALATGDDAGPLHTCVPAGECDGGAS